jgi:hypothetical protein
MPPMKELGIDHVAGGKIVREEFFHITRCNATSRTGAGGRVAAAFQLVRTLR